MVEKFNYAWMWKPTAKDSSSQTVEGQMPNFAAKALLLSF